MAVVKEAQVSFMDPDFREAMQRESERKRELCRKSGGHSYKPGTFVCTTCHETNLDPRVTLVNGDLRAVWKPREHVVVIEKRSTDSLGAERWDAIEQITRQGSGYANTYRLLSEGTKP